MKILKEGKVPKEAIYIFSCSDCGCEFEASKKDGINIFYDMQNKEYVMMICPCCCSTINDGQKK